MIFSPEAIQMIRERRKTQTRRVLKTPKGEIVMPEVAKSKIAPCRYGIGHRYKAQSGRGIVGDFYVTVFAVRQERLGDISQQDAQREGFRFIAQFLKRWEDLHGTPNPDQQVWVISFEYGDLTDRFDHPRLLAAHPGRVRFTPTGARVGEGGALPRWEIAADVEEHQDYTDEPSLSVKQEDEGPSAAVLDQYAKQAHARDRDRPRVQLAVERDRIADSLSAMRETLAEEPDREISRTVRALEHQLASLDRKIRYPA